MTTTSEQDAEAQAAMLALLCPIEWQDFDTLLFGVVDNLLPYSVMFQEDKGGWVCGRFADTPFSPPYSSKGLAKVGCALFHATGKWPDA